MPRFKLKIQMISFSSRTPHTFGSSTENSNLKLEQVTDDIEIDSEIEKADKRTQGEISRVCQKLKVNYLNKPRTTLKMSMT